MPPTPRRAADLEARVAELKALPRHLNAKLEGDGWFPGFSLLFRNGAEDHARGERAGFERLELKLERRGPFALYHAFAAALEETDVASPFLVPTSTYHCTAADVSNIGLVSPSPVDGRGEAPGRAELAEMLAAIPQSLAPGACALADWMHGHPILEAELDLEFGFRSLHFDGFALVADLEARDPAGFADFVALRRRFYEDVEKRFALPVEVRKRDRFKPHCTLAYFRSIAEVEAGVARRESWNQIFRRRLDGLSIAYHGVDLYLFEDMRVYWRAEKKCQEPIREAGR
jgi:hypothetical protein